MKKIFTRCLCLFAVILLSYKPSSAQTFEKEKSYLSVGYGFGTFLGSLSANLDDEEGFSSSLTGPIYGKYEYGITETFGIGINLAYVEYKFNYKYDDYDPYTGLPTKYIQTDTYSSFSGLIRANWHFGSSDKVDPYFGIGLGYRNGIWKHISNDPEGTRDAEFSIPIPFGFETTFGLRLLFSDNFGAYLEAGLAKSAMQVGLCGKF